MGVGEPTVAAKVREREREMVDDERLERERERAGWLAINDEKERVSWCFEPGLRQG